MHRPVIARGPVVAALLASVAMTAQAQTVRSTRFVDDCKQYNRDTEVFCETRTVNLAATKLLHVDGHQNGGVTVHAWDNSNVQVVAMVQSRARSMQQAQNIARNINVTAKNGDISADGPDMGSRDRDYRNDESWSVSFEVWAPRGTDLDLVASNGGISIDGMNSKMDLRTSNGGLTLINVEGDVHGSTTNGGVTAELSGDRWRGAGLDLRTTNGGVRITMPERYSARLETGTVNGSMDLGFPITVQGRLNRNISTDIGSGGATIRATTTNGGVSIRRK